MSNEWKRSTWSFRPQAPAAGLSHTYTNILHAIHTALTDAGWALASWSNGGVVNNDNYYIRPDRYRVDVTHKLFGPSGNAVISVTGAALSDNDLTGGAFGTSGSTQASGYIALAALPADGDTITMTDGTTSVIFEFESSGGVIAGHVPVVIGSTIENTLENLSNAINGVSGYNITAVPHWHWWFTGDNYYQHCGINVRYVAGGPNIQIGSFLENNTKTGSYRSCVDVSSVVIAYDTTTQNDFLFMCGEDGFYVEGGSNGNYNNIAHGMIFAYYPDATLFGTRDRERTWFAQGITYDLRGNIRSADRNYRFVETVGDRRNHTGQIMGKVVRGSVDTVTKSMSNDYDMYFGPREHILTGGAYTNTSDNSMGRAFNFTLGLIQSNFDDLYRVSHLAVPHNTWFQTAMNTGDSRNVGVLTTLYTYAWDIRNSLRHVPKFGCCSSYLLPWNNIVDKRTNLTFRVAQVVDGGRNSNLCIVWPDNSNVTTIPATP